MHQQDWTRTKHCSHVAVAGRSSSSAHRAAASRGPGPLPGGQPTALASNGPGACPIPPFCFHLWLNIWHPRPFPGKPPFAPCLYQSHPASITALFMSPRACEQPAGKSLWAKSHTDKLKSFKSFTNYMASRHPKHFQRKKEERQHGTLKMRMYTMCSRGRQSRQMAWLMILATLPTGRCMSICQIAQ